MMRLTKDKSVLLVIDIQERLFPFIAENEKLVKNVPVLVEGMKAIGVPVLATEQYVKGLGTTIPSVLGVLGTIPRTEKMAFSCCDEPRFMENLAVLGREQVIITGIETHVCVLQTVLDLKANGYQPVVVEDCVSSRRLSDKQTALARIRQEGGVVTSYESVLFELLRFSGTDTFRTVSKLVK
jgi:nicotinamidase-related amidase